MKNKKPAFFPSPFYRGIGGLAILNVLLFGDLFFNPGRVLSSSQADLYLHFVAWRQFAFDQLRQGHLVLWNPHYLCGSPFFGNFESAILYPLNWFYLFLPLGFATNLVVVLHVFLAGLFTYLWACRRGLHPLACFTAGTLFMFGGAFYLHLFAGHLPNLGAMVWAPLLFLALDGWLGTPGMGWILLGIFALTLQVLSGHPQYVYFTGLIALLYFCLNLRGKKEKGKLALGGLAMAGGAFLLSAVQLWTGLEALGECGRNNPMEFHSAASFSFPPQNLLTLILPDFFGNLSGSHYWSQWFLWEVSVFMGITGFFLAVFATASAPSLKRNWALTTSLVALVLSMGAFTPFYRFLYDFFPWFQSFRGVCKFDFLACLFLALMAGIGLDYLMRERGRTRWPFFLTVIFGLFLAGLAFFLWISAGRGTGGIWGKWFVQLHWLKNTLRGMATAEKETMIQKAGLQAALSLWGGAVTCAFLSAFLMFRKKFPAMVYAIAALSVVEVFLFARANRPTFELAPLQKKFERIRGIYEKDPGDYRVYGTGSASLVTGAYDLWEDEPMVLGRYGRFVCYSQGLNENQLFSVVPIYQKFGKIFGMLRLKYLVSANQDPPQLYPLPFPRLPRMLLLNQWERVPDPQALLEGLFKPGFDPGRKVFLESDPTPRPFPGRVRGDLQWNDLSTEKIEVKAKVPQPTLLFITDNYSRNWRANALPGSAQGRYQVMPGNYFLRVIPLAAGDHHFILEYRPPAFTAGKWVSIISSLLYVGVLLFHLKRKKPGALPKVIS